MSTETAKTETSSTNALTFARYLDLWATVHKCIYKGIHTEGGGGGGVCIRGSASPEALADLIRRVPADLWVSVDRRPAPDKICPADRGLFGWALASP